MFETLLLRHVFGYVTQEVTGDLKNMAYEELHKLYSLLIIFSIAPCWCQRAKMA
jgi:hypothetical protein